MRINFFSYFDSYYMLLKFFISSQITLYNYVQHEIYYLLIELLEIQ